MKIIRCSSSVLVSKVLFLKPRNNLYKILTYSNLHSSIFEGQIYKNLRKQYNHLYPTRKQSLHENKMSVSKLSESDTWSTFITSKISKNKVVIFSKTTCPFCTKIKEKFKSVQQSFIAIELNMMGTDGIQIQNILYEMTKQKTVPNIFINGTHVGGCDSTMKLFDNGKIFQLLANSSTHQENKFDPTFNPVALINDEIKNNKVIIFSKTTCPYCKTAKEKFKSINQEFKTIELDLLGEQGVQIQNALLEKSGQKTVPNIFINGKHIGGCDATLKLFETGDISNILSTTVKPTFNPVALINDEIKNNKVIIFSKTTCPYCKTAKEKFKSINQEFKTIELDLLGEQGLQIQNALLEKSGQKTVPNIFINGEHIGGCDATLKLFQDGSINELLAFNFSSSSKKINVEQILKNNQLVLFGQVDDVLKENIKSFNYIVESLTDEVKQELYIRSGKKLYSYIFYNQQQVTVDELKSIDSTFIKLDEYINSNKIVIYSKTYCPFCKQAKVLLAENEYNYQVIELDTLSSGAQIQEALFEKTGQKTVPYIFINGKHIGGCSDLLDTYYDGRFYDYMDNNFKTYDYDLCVIGGGSGGISAAKEAASMNKKVALFDFVTPSQHGTIWGLGGTCVNVGCIPKKLFHKASLLNEEARSSDKFGFGIEKSFSWKMLVDNVQKYIHSLNNNYEQELQKNNIDYFNAKAVFVDKHMVKFLKQEKTLSAQNFIIAVGGRPTYPDIPGAHLGITSDDLFSLNRDPGKVLLVGASYIALECAGFLNGLGYDTTVMVRSILLRGFDQDIANMIGEDLASRGVKFIRSHVPTELSKQEEHILVKAEDTNTKEKYECLYNTVVFAIGRTACTQDLNLNALNISVQPNKKIDAFNEKTNVHSVYAVGDVINNAPELTPVAIKAGKLLVKRLYRKTTEQINYKLVPTTVFTPLEYGCVGYSETDAKATFKNIVVYHNQFVPLENALENEPRKCYAKLVCDADDNDKVIGLHVLGPNAGEITQGFALGIMMGASKKNFDTLIGIHPTCAEVFTTMNVSKESNEKLQSSGC